MRKRTFVIAIVSSLLLGSLCHAAEGWKRHTIDDTSRGADGVRTADVNGDGLIDLVTGWEEGGVVRVYLHPGPKKSKERWPAVTVGKVRSPEDAVFVDLDGDGATDVVSSCEGRERSLFVHWAPKDKSKYLDAAAWKTEPLPASLGKAMWMFCVPVQMDGKRGVDLVAGSKGTGAGVGWFESPENPRDLAAWKWRAMYAGGWIMSLFEIDIDADGDPDVVITDRKGKNSGCRWLENPGPKSVGSPNPWKEHLVGGKGQEVMFARPVDLDRNGLLDFVTAVRGDDFLYFRRQPGKTPSWKTSSIKMPTNTGTGKGVHVNDFDLDGRLDLVFTCENAQKKSGVMWLSRRADQPVTSPDWLPHEISGRKEGIKFDRIELLDLDADGDLDVITCEERDNLGVIWYENPTK